MILMKNLQIIFLVVGLCGTWFHTSHAQTSMCAGRTEVHTCDVAKPYCGVDGNGEGFPIGCVASECPDPVTDELSCADGKTYCCCKAAEKPCNDLINDPAIREKACKIPKLAKLQGCDKQISCNDDNDKPLPNKCKHGAPCGAQKDGIANGCAHRDLCPATLTSEITCDDSRQYCCCNTDNCNTKAGVCAASKACTTTTSPAPSSKRPAPTGTNTKAPGEGSAAGRPATTMSVLFLVTLTSVTGFLHHVFLPFV